MRGLMRLVGLVVMAVITLVGCGNKEIEIAPATEGEMEPPIFAAIRNGSLGEVKDAVAADPNAMTAIDPATGLAPIHRAVALGHADIVQYFIDEGVDVNSRDGNGRTPLGVANDMRKSGAIVSVLEAAGGQE
ncbi:MAG: hypothetical protein AMXMBFR84_01510 [Candidatus Hydrogenedentota bacterium]